MEVTVVLYAGLGSYHPRGRGSEPFTLQLPRGSTVDDLLAELKLGRDEARLVFIEHTARPGDHVLQDGHKAAIFPPIAGG